jgi:hypothetical protein
MYTKMNVHIISLEEISNRNNFTIELSEEDFGRPLWRLLGAYSREVETGHLFAELHDQKKKKNEKKFAVMLSGIIVNGMFNINCDIESTFVCYLLR